MAIDIKSEDYDILKQPYINKYLRVDLLDFDYNVIRDITGHLTKCSVSVDADSDLRRNCDVSMVITDDTVDISPEGGIWLNRYIQPYVGYENAYTGKIQWYNQGIFLINEPTWQYDSSTNELSFKGVDLMAKMTGLRNGNLEGIPTVVPQGSDVRGAIIQLLEMSGFTSYIVDECVNDLGGKQEVPYDLQVEQGGTVYDMLAKLRDIVPNYQMYFDVNGTFHYDRIPSGANEAIAITDDLWNNIVLSESNNVPFEEVKNTIEVYGKTHSTDNYPTETTATESEGTISLTIPSLSDSTLPEYTLIAFNLESAFEPPNVFGGIRVSVTNSQNTGAFYIVNGANENILRLEAGYHVMHVHKFAGNWYWLYLGGLQAHAVVQETNRQSPFNIYDNGIIRVVLSGGDYENITSDELAKERAQLELYWKCRLKDSVALSVIPIPWLDVNILVSHALRDETEEKQWMIKSFSVDYGEISEMKIEMIAYYPYYEEV